MPRKRSPVEAREIAHEFIEGKSYENIGKDHGKVGSINPAQTEEQKRLSAIKTGEAIIKSQAVSQAIREIIKDNESIREYVKEEHAKNYENLKKKNEGHPLAYQELERLGKTGAAYSERLIHEGVMQHQIAALYMDITDGKHCLSCTCDNKQ